MNKKLRVLTGAILAAAMGSTSAAIISFEDDDLDFHLRPDANGVLQPVAPDFVNGTALLDNDVLIAVLEYNTANGVPFEPGQELTGVAVIQAQVTGAGAFNFVPFAGGFNAAVNTFGTNGIAVTEGQAGGGAMFALWLDPAPTDLDVDGSLVNTAGGFSCGTLGACLDQASNGVLFEVDGFEDGDNSYWTALSTTADPTEILLGEVTDIFGFFNAGLSILDAAASGADTDEPFVGDLGPIDVLLSGTINGGGFNQWVNTAQRDTLVASGFVATTDNQLQKSIPTPAPLAMLGAGLLGLRLARRRRA
jgi:hypothetical protein